MSKTLFEEELDQSGIIAFFGIILAVFLGACVPHGIQHRCENGQLYESLPNSDTWVETGKRCYKEYK